MKKLLVILIVLVLALSLFACGTTTTPASPSPTQTAAATPEQSTAPSPSPTTAATPASPQTSGSADALHPNAGQVGYYDPSYAYSQNKTYKFAYLTYQSSALYDDFANSFKVWAAKANCTVDVIDTNNDNDLFISTLDTLKAQGYDGVFTDPDSTTYQAVVAECQKIGLPMMPVMGLPEDDNGNLVTPHVGFDYYQVGQNMGQWLVDYWQKNWPDVPGSQIGVLGVDYSIVPEISERISGALSVIKQAIPDICGEPDASTGRIDQLTNSGRYYHADTITGNMDSTTAYQVSGAILSTHPEITHWLIVATIDDYGTGAVQAAQDAGLQGNVIAISMGSPGLVAQWESGDQTDFKASITSIGPIYAEPIFFGLYAIVHGDATPETIWPQWVDHSTGATYPELLLPSVVLTYDNYQQYRAWVNLYCGEQVYPVPAGVTATPDMFSAAMSPPASYAGS